MCGSSCCSYALLILHVFLNCLYAALVCSCFFPCIRFFALYSRRASLHNVLNQGARCLAQRFGFLYCLVYIALTTPTAMASSIRNSSTRYVRVSLSSWHLSDIAVNFAANWSVEVCAFHVFALRIYSVVSSPPIHIYLVLLLTGGVWRSSCVSWRVPAFPAGSPSVVCGVVVGGGWGLVCVSYCFGGVCSVVCAAVSPRLKSELKK